MYVTLTFDKENIKDRMLLCFFLWEVSKKQRFHSKEESRNIKKLRWSRSNGSVEWNDAVFEDGGAGIAEIFPQTSFLMI